MQVASLLDLYTSRLADHMRVTRYTSKGENIYAIVLNWPKDNLLTLGSLQTFQGDSIYMLGVKKPLSYTQTKSNVVINFPYLTPDTLPSTVAWVLKVTRS
ncbi:alpha-L-fucosidase [Caerostris extrusa]|uniref:Alpha-L-fucosidase n=1 Tax=Caerostris extrusa TaxID=172846 RepID=A0AAV4SGL1_CAEEX|nr:alpha-L-fucosidase [Caerostris extrusa]